MEPATVDPVAVDPGTGNPGTGNPGTGNPGTGGVGPLTEAGRALARVGRILEHVPAELTLPQYRLLIMVASGDHRASQLAGRLALSRPTVTAVVDGLVERGMLTRSEVSGDRRAVQLTLTDAGRSALVATDAAIGERLQCVLDHCEDPGLALAGLGQLAGALPRLVAEKLREGGR